MKGTDSDICPLFSLIPFLGVHANLQGEFKNGRGFVAAHQQGLPDPVPLEPKLEPTGGLIVELGLSPDPRVLVPILLFEVVPIVLPGMTASPGLMPELGLIPCPGLMLVPAALGEFWLQE